MLSNCLVIRMGNFEKLHFGCYTFLKHHAAAALNARMDLNLKMHNCQTKGTETSYCEAVNHLLRSYSAEDIIAEIVADMTPFTEL